MIIQVHKFLGWDNKAFFMDPQVNNSSFVPAFYAIIEKKKPTMAGNIFWGEWKYEKQVDDGEAK